MNSSEMLCVDASLVIPFLIEAEPGSPIVELWRRYAAQSLQIALDMPFAVYHDASLHRRALQMAERFSLPATYDAHYLALAERMGAAFWTADRRLYRATQAELAWVNLWPEEETAV